MFHSRGPAAVVAVLALAGWAPGAVSVLVQAVLAPVG